MSAVPWSKYIFLRNPTLVVSMFSIITTMLCFISSKLQTTSSTTFSLFQIQAQKAPVGNNLNCFFPVDSGYFSQFSFTCFHLIASGTLKFESDPEKQRFIHRFYSFICSLVTKNLKAAPFPWEWHGFPYMIA